MHLEKLGIPSFIVLVIVFLVFLFISGKSYAFDAHPYARAGIGIQMYTSDAGGVCNTVDVIETAEDSEGNTVNIRKTHKSGYVGYADAGIWLHPGASIYMLAGYHFIGCTGDGVENHGPMLGLRVGKTSYMEVKGAYISNNKETGKEPDKIAYQYGVGSYSSYIGGLSVDAFGYVKGESVTGVLGLTFNF